MLRRFVCAVFALVLTVGVVVAAEYKGEVKSVSGDSITISVDGKDVKLPVSSSCEVVGGKPGAEKAVKGGVAKLKEGTKVTATTETKDGKEVVTKIRLGGKKK